MEVNYKIIKLRKEILNTNQRFYRNNKVINIFDKCNIPVNKSISQRLFQLLITENFNRNLLIFSEEINFTSPPKGMDKDFREKWCKYFYIFKFFISLI